VPDGDVWTGEGVGAVGWLTEGSGDSGVGSAEVDEGSGARDARVGALTGLAAYSRVGPDDGADPSVAEADDDLVPGAGDRAGVGCELGDPGPSGEPDGVEPWVASAAPMMSDAGVIPGGAFWIEANAAVVPRTATTATSGTTSRSSTLGLFHTRSPTTTYERDRQDVGPADPRNVQETTGLRREVLDHWADRVTGSRDAPSSPVSTPS
jgi:hypothetical protein